MALDTLDEASKRAYRLAKLVMEMRAVVNPNAPIMVLAQEILSTTEAEIERLAYEQFPVDSEMGEPWHELKATKT